MSWAAVIVAGGAVTGALINSNSAGNASDAQQAATQSAIDEQRRQYDLNRADLAPWRQAGTGAINRLSSMLQPGGDLMKKFTVADFMEDPVTKLSFQHGLETGTTALDRMAGARGSRNSGSQLKALTRFGTDYTGTKAGESYNRFYGDQDRIYNRLAGVAGTGQTASTNTAQLGQMGAQNIGNLLTAQGNARGAASIAQGNAVSGGLNTIGNWYQQQAMLNQLNQQNQPQYTGYDYAGGPAYG